MKRFLTGLTRNIMAYQHPETGVLMPHAELVHLVAVRQYGADERGNLGSRHAIEQDRVFVDAKMLRRMADVYQDIADELDELNDEVGGDDPDDDDDEDEDCDCDECSPRPPVEYREYQVGDRVLVEDMRGQRHPGTVTEKSGDLYRLKRDDAAVWKDSGWFEWTLLSPLSPSPALPVFQKGARVVYREAGNPLPAEVIEACGGDFYRIRFDDSSARSNGLIVHGSEIDFGGRPQPVGTLPGPTEFKPGDRVMFRDMQGGVHASTVVEAFGSGGSYKVRCDDRFNHPNGFYTFAGELTPIVAESLPPPAPEPKPFLAGDRVIFSGGAAGEHAGTIVDGLTQSREGREMIRITFDGCEVPFWVGVGRLKRAETPAIEATKAEPLFRAGDRIVCFHDGLDRRGTVQIDITADTAFAVVVFDGDPDLLWTFPGNLRPDPDAPAVRFRKGDSVQFLNEFGHPKSAIVDEDVLLSNSDAILKFVQTNRDFSEYRDGQRIIVPVSRIERS